MVETVNLRPSAAFLNIIFTGFSITPRNGDNTLLVEGGNQVDPIRHGDNAGIILFLCAIKHIIVNSVEEVGNALCDISQRERILIPSISTDRKTLPLGKIVGTNFETQWNSLSKGIRNVSKRLSELGSHFLLPIIELISRSITLPQVRLGPNTCLLQCLNKLVASGINLGSLRIRHLSCNPTRDDNNLDACNSRRQNQTLVISVYHHHYTNCAG